MFGRTIPIFHESLELYEDTMLALDAETVHVTGEVTLEEEPMPDDDITDGYPRGAVVFSSAVWYSRTETNLKENGAATFSPLASQPLLFVPPRSSG